MIISDCQHTVSSTLSIVCGYEKWHSDDAMLPVVILVRNSHMLCFEIRSSEKCIVIIWYSVLLLRTRTCCYAKCKNDVVKCHKLQETRIGVPTVRFINKNENPFLFTN